MITRLRTHISTNFVAYIALFVALGGTSYAAVKVTSQQIANNTIRSADIRNNTIASKDVRNRALKGIDIGRGSLSGEHFQSGALPAGPQGPPGSPGAPGATGPRGPSFGDTVVLGNVDMACNDDTVVGSLPVTVPERTRIWVAAYGAIQDNSSAQDEYELRHRLRDGGGAVVASSGSAWGADTADLSDEVVFLAQSGVLFAGANGGEVPGGTPFVADPGSYTLELVARAQGGSNCDSPPPQPRFGWNSGTAMSYMLLGTG